MRRPRSGSRVNADDGVALLLVLLFIVLLAVLVVEFSFDARVDATIASASSSDLSAVMAGKSGIAAAKGVLASDLLVSEAEAESFGAREVYDSLEDVWAGGIPPVVLNDAEVELRIVDEFGKINLNALLYDDAGEGEAEREELVLALRYVFTAVMGLTNDPTDALLEWLDSDDDPSRPLGYENGYYQSLNPPYQAKNGPMDSLEELLLIPGFTYEMFAGNAEEGYPPLDEMLTVHGDPLGRVNINTASYSVLEAMFAVYQERGGISPRQALNLLGQRDDEEGPFVTDNDVVEWLRASGVIAPPPQEPDPNAPGDDTEDPPDGQNDPNRPRVFEQNLFTVASNVFRVDSDVQTETTDLRVRAYIWRDTQRLQKLAQDGGANALAAQLFRTVEWRVMR